MRTIIDIDDLLIPIEDTIGCCFKSVITGDRICSEKERNLLSLRTRYGELAIPIFHEQADVKYNNSRRIIAELTRLIKRQHTGSNVEELNMKKIKQGIKKEKESLHH